MQEAQGWKVFCCCFFKILFIYVFIFREKRKEGERKGEKHQCVIASHVAPIGDLAHNPGMCPDWELNQRPFGSQSVLSPLSYTRQDSREGIYTES